jgi:PKD repeat protein
MYKAVFEEDITNIGYVTNFANITVLNVHGDIGMSNVRTYLWLGDASIEPWTMQPMDLAVSHDAQLFLGMSEFTVTVIGQGGPAENAMVCVANEDHSIYAVAYADASGLATIDFGAPVQDPGMVTVTVTSHNYLPYQAEIPVVPQEGPYVVKDSYVINDETGGNGNGMMDYAESILLSLSVKNVGIEVAEDVIVTISSEDEYVTITDGEETYGDVNPDEIITVEDGFALDVAEDIPDGHAVIFDVIATDGTDNWGSTLVINGHAPLLAFNGYSVDDASGNNNGFLDPGETVIMTVNVINNGSAEAFSVMAELTSSDPMLTVITSDPQEIGDLVPEMNEQAEFTVYADPDIVPGYAGELDLMLTADLNISQEDVISVPFTDYCDASTSTEDEFIANVSFGEIDNSSGWQGGVADYTDIATTLEPGVAEAMTIENGNAWASDIVTVWIDWNMDKELGNDPGETYQLTNVGGQGQTFTGNIAPPDNQQGGQYRMRIRMTYSSAPQPCGNATYGEVEDYTVFIGETLSANFNADVTELCEGNEVHYTDNSSGDVLSWSWEFEGGDPATSTEQNPTVMYMEGGDWDVSLTVTGENGSNTMMHEDYITTMFMPESAGDIIGNEETCQGYEEVYTVDEISWADTYSWVLEPEEAGEMTMEDNVATIMISDDYEGAATLKVCGGNQCGEGGWSTEFSIVVNTCVGIYENDKATMAVYPNPSTGQFTLDLTANDVVNVRIMNAIGEVVFEMNDLTVDGRTTTSIDLNSLAEGVYYLKLEGNHTNIFEKIVIAR